MREISHNLTPLTVPPDAAAPDGPAARAEQLRRLAAAAERSQETRTLMVIMHLRRMLQNP